MSDHYDSPWKDVLDRYFPEFMAFFFPAAFREIDWSKGYESLDQELHQVVRDAESGKRFADKLMKVWLFDGGELYVVIHIEVQGQRDKDFPLRMYVYNYRLFDRHQRPVVSLAVLCDDSSGWRPEEYSHELWGCRASLTFPTVKLTDYNVRWPELEESANPFAIVVMSHLKARATHGDPPSRLRWKMHLVRGLYEGGWERQDVLELFRFVDWVLALPAELAIRFDDEIKELERKKAMRYVTSIERSGHKRGLKEGLERGLEQGQQQGFLLGEASLLKRQLKRRFERLPEWVEERLERASRDELEGWADRVIEARALEDVFA
jgi:hypothetical protein